MAPTRSADRIALLDVLRGFALLGILLMNILSFGLPGPAEANPTVLGGSGGLNWTAWFLQIVVFDGKMRAMFSLLFGAGVILLTSRATPDIADIYYRRNLWLILFGMVHAYIFWYGDILYYYGLYALILFPLRLLPVKALIRVPVAMLLGMTGFGIYEAIQLPEIKQKALAAAKVEKPNEEQKKAKERWEDMLKNWQPSSEEINKELKAYRGNYVENFKRRAETVSGWHSGPYYSPGSWDIVAFLLLGMGFFKAGVLTGERPTGFYLKLLCFGYGAGLTLNAALAWRLSEAKWDLIVASQAFAFYQLGRLLVVLGHVGLLVLIVKRGVLTGLTQRLAAVGQMAFSNYISHTLIATTLFYGGYGFGLFGKLERAQLYGVVLAIWVAQLIISPIWLRHYRFGPLEWAWRSLTYWQRQPFRLTPAGDQAAEEQPRADEELGGGLGIGEGGVLPALDLEGEVVAGWRAAGPGQGDGAAQRPGLGEVDAADAEVVRIADRATVQSDDVGEIRPADR
ncbi:MAG: DUF418 domain-containing protein [Bryobacteraceae bacterium]|nr:DUF418 domain-containing protein [Bryobacteraceae bacterium]